MTQTNTQAAKITNPKANAARKAYRLRNPKPARFANFRQRRDDNKHPLVLNPSPCGPTTTEPA